jgi:hypothetical protein
MGLELPSTLVFDYPTVNALTGHLSSRVAAAVPALGVGEEEAWDGNASEFDDQLSVGMTLSEGSMQSPHVVGISKLVVRSSGDALLSTLPADESRPVPLERWDVETQAELYGGTPVQFGVFLDRVDSFDAAALGLGETEASLMDPQQRLLLETVAEAVLCYPQETADEGLRANWGAFVVSELLPPTLQPCSKGHLPPPLLFHARYLLSSAVTLPIPAGRLF